MMLNKIIEFAKKDERIRAAILNGSRANPKAIGDIFQDYDVVLIVTDVSAFVADQSWINTFGDCLIMQTPDIMSGAWPNYPDKFTFLIQFKDGARLDASLHTQSSFFAKPIDSLSQLLVDKDQLLPADLEPSESEYLPKPPSAKQFSDCCNEFYWVSTYVAKGLWRKHILYSKHMSENIVKSMLIQMLVWHAAIKTEFQVNFGSNHKYLEHYLEPELWQALTQTYVGVDTEQMWQALMRMQALFHQVAARVASHFGFEYSSLDHDNVNQYLNSVKMKQG